MAGWTYDSGALIAAERDDRRLWGLHIRALGRNIAPIVPTVVLTQVWRGGSPWSLVHFLDGCDIEPLSESVAREAGVALARSGTQDITDAIVVVTAMRRQHTVVTSDRGDIERIARALAWRPDIIDV
jgi:predicted nucleic acid-binding protein